MNVVGPTSVGVNLLWLRPGHVGGTESYARRVLRSLSNHDGDADADLDSDLTLHLFGTTPGIEAVKPSGQRSSMVSHVVRPGPIPRAQRVVVERTVLPSATRAVELDVLHHLGGTVPFDSTVPSVVTIHDLQPLDQPENFSPAKVRFLRSAIPAAIERSAVIATPSNWVREQIISRFDLDPRRVQTVSAFAEPVDLAGPIERSMRLEAIVADGPIVLFPAMTLGHKNHSFLFDAFGDALKRDPDLQLISVGAIGRDHDALVAKAASVSPRIRMLGHVSKHDLDVLYRSADAVVFPSRYEGFGLPVLETQHYGVPVLSSNVTALPEVAGDGALLLDPDDRTAWADAMVKRFSPVERSQAVARGFKNAARYSLNSTAQQQQRVYSQAIA